VGAPLRKKKRKRLGQSGLSETQPVGSLRGGKSKRKASANVDDLVIEGKKGREWGGGERRAGEACAGRGGPEEVGERFLGTFSIGRRA